MKNIKKIIIDLTPGLLFIIATMFINKSLNYNDSYFIVGVILYGLGYASFLDLHTYLINKLNEKEIINKIKKKENYRH